MPDLTYLNPLSSRLGVEFFSQLPSCPGVYYMHHEDGRILYIGKAKSLRGRLADYKNARPGRVPDHTIELIENIASIRWEEHRTEKAALSREIDLIRAIRPPYNIRGTEEIPYFYIATQAGPEALLKIQLTTRRECVRGYRVHGCYPNRYATKRGYIALLRLLFAATTSQARFSFPARISRESPPYAYAMTLPNEFLKPLEQFLDGKTISLLRILIERMLLNETIPAFVRPGLQDDFNEARKFYSRGPKISHQARKFLGIRNPVLSHRKMNAWFRDRPLNC